MIEPGRNDTKTSVATKIGLALFVVGLLIFGYIEYMHQTAPLALGSHSWCCTTNHIEPSPIQTSIVAGLCLMIAGCGLMLADRLGYFNDA